MFLAIGKILGVNISKNAVFLHQLTKRERYLRIMREYPDFVASENIILYGYPWLILLGTLGNILTFAVMRTRLSSITSTYFYMTVLAAADITILLNGALRKWISQATDFNPSREHEVLCKLISYVHYWCFDFSAWILVAMTAERFIAVHWPLRCIDHTGKAKARKVIIGISIVLAIVNIPLLWMLKIVDGECDCESQYKEFILEIWPIIDATVYSFMPFTFLLLFNILIIRELQKATAAHGHLQATTDTRPPLTNFHRRLTIMLLCISFTFLITSAPNVIHTIIRYKVHTEKGSYENAAKIILGNTISSIFLYMMHSINFFLYSISGRKFRQELVEMLRGWQCGNPTCQPGENLKQNVPLTIEMTNLKTSCKNKTRNCV